MKGIGEVLQAGAFDLVSWGAMREEVKRLLLVGVLGDWLKRGVGFLGFRQSSSAVISFILVGF